MDPGETKSPENPESSTVSRQWQTDERNRLKMHFQHSATQDIERSKSNTTNADLERIKMCIKNIQPLQINIPEKETYSVDSKWSEDKNTVGNRNNIENNFKNNVESSSRMTTIYGSTNAHNFFSLQ